MPRNSVIRLPKKRLIRFMATMVIVLSIVNLVAFGIMGVGCSGEK